MEISDRTIFYGALACMIIEYLWEIYLDIRQRRVQMKHVHIPGELIGILPPETFEKARLYALDKRNFGIVKDTISVLFNLLFLLCNGLYLLWAFSGHLITYIGYEPIEKNEIIQSSAFLLLSNFLNKLVELPLSIYYTFVLEEKHGFNKQTASFYIKDTLKAYILQQILTVILSCGIVYIVKIGGDYFFIYTWLFVTILIIFIYTIYPDFIAPLFDKYIPLPPGELRTDIENFAKSLNFPLSDLYVVIGSKRSAHSNAYFYGFFKKKRIVLFDTLLKDFDSSLYDDDIRNKKEKEEKKELDEKDYKDEKRGCDNNEVLAVLGHELGHWKLNHSIKNLIIGELNLLFVFVIFAKLFRYQALYRAFGFYDSTPVLIGFQIILQFIFLLFFALVKYFSAMLSRRFEFQADQFAKAQGRRHFLEKALIKLNRDNLEFPIYDRWYSEWHNSHPPLLERLQALDKDD